MKTTIKLSALVEQVNKMLAGSVDSISKQREGIASLLEHILHDNGVYDGFNYLTKVQLKGKATIPGIERKGSVFIYPDETRKAYHISPKLIRGKKE